MSCVRQHQHMVVQTGRCEARSKGSIVQYHQAEPWRTTFQLDLSQVMLSLESKDENLSGNRHHD